MPNKNYLAGRRAEWRARDMLKKVGYHTVVRAAGSKGLVDLIAISRHGTLLIQVKHGRARAISPTERRGLVELKAQIPTNCWLEIWRFTKGERIPAMEVV